MANRLVDKQYALIEFMICASGANITGHIQIDHASQAYPWITRAL